MRPRRSKRADPRGQRIPLPARSRRPVNGKASQAGTTFVIDRRSARRPSNGARRRAVTSTSATLNGSVNPEGKSKPPASFEYGTSLSYGQNGRLHDLAGQRRQRRSWPSPRLSRGSAGSSALPLPAWSPKTTVVKKAMAATQTFTTSEAPRRRTVGNRPAASRSLETTATLKGSVDPARRNDELQVRIRHDDGLRHDAPLCPTPPGSGTAETSKCPPRWRTRRRHDLPLPAGR